MSKKMVPSHSSLRLRISSIPSLCRSSNGGSRFATKGWASTSASGISVSSGIRRGMKAGSCVDSMMRVNFMAGAAIAKVAVVWRGDGVEITLTTAKGVRTLRAATAIVHEPMPRLYERLPLTGFDSDARQFWNRVFRLIRIPGGRYLLGFIARRNRGARTPRGNRSGPASH